MKGVKLLSEFFLLFLIIVVAAAMTGVVGLLSNYNIAYRTYDVTPNLFYRPLTHESALMSFLESTDPETGIPMKKIVVAALNQGRTEDVYVDGHIINVKEVTEPILTEIIGSDSYVLVSNEPNMELAGRYYRIGTTVFVAETQVQLMDGTTATIGLYS